MHLSGNYNKQIKLWGGLGNQLFQYAFGLYIKKTTKENIAFYKQPTSLNTKDLEILLNNNITILDHTPLLYKINFVYRVIRKITRKKITILNTFIEKRLVKKSVPNNVKYYDGYWQNHFYVEKVKTELFNSINFNETITDCCQEFISKIEQTNSASLHIRLGDYLDKKNQKIFESCTDQYYINAIKALKEKVTTPLTLFIFSNNIKLAKQHFEKIKIDEDIKIEFVEGIKNSSALIDLYLMSKCKHNIIANSTYSWWGAYLNQNTNKIVIAPKSWYKGDLNNTTVDLIPQQWIRI